MSGSTRRITRRQAIKTGVMAGAGLALYRYPAFAAVLQDMPLVTKPIPKSGERIPVVGVGTNAYGVRNEEEKAPLREVLKSLPELGGKVVDTAHSYRGSEGVIGEITASLGNRDRLFFSTKASTRNDDVAEAVTQMEESLASLKTDHLDLLSVHNLAGTDVMMPVLREWKQAGKIRYIGVTTSSDRQHDALMETMKKHALDFIQVNYSIGNRSVADDVLPLAAEQGVAVMLNVPFGGRPSAAELFETVSGKSLPEWAKEFDCGSWAQFFLKYLVSHPAVTVAIPGTRSLMHLADNLGAARGRMPDVAMRKRMETYWDSISG